MEVCNACKLGPGPQVPLEEGGSPILWIGEAPGATEAELGRPFCGSSGRFLRAIWREAFRGTKWDKPWVINCVLCRPPGNRDPKKEEVEACAPFVEQALKRVQPEVAVLYGDVAIKKFFGHRASWKRLSSLPYGKDGRWFFPMPHPAMVLRKREYISYFRWLHLRLRKWLERGFVFDRPYDELVVCVSSDQAIWWIKQAEQAEFAALDIETTKGEGDEDVVDPFDPTARVLGFSLAFRDRAGAVIAVYCDGNFLEDQGLRGALSGLFAKRKLVIQNAPFDISFLERAGVRTAPVRRDTKVALWLIHTDSPRRDLAFLQALYTFYPPHKEELRAGTAVGSLPKEKLIAYNAADSGVLLGVSQAQEVWVPKKRLPWGQTLEEWVLELQWISIQMKMRGIRVDLEELKRIEQGMAPRLKELEEWFLKRGINPRSNPQLFKLFFEELKLPKKPGKGKSLDREVLSWLADRFPDEEAVQKLKAYRELEQLRKAFFAKLPRLIKPDGRLHPNWVVDGTGTGRWSCKEPNMQQVPKELRSFVLCTLAGDYDRMELWVLAYDAEDYELAEVLKHSDVHEEVRREISASLGREIPRRQAKSVVFGYVYGQTPHGLARALGITVKEAEIFQASLEKRFPALKRWKERRIREATMQGYLETPFGLRRYVEKPTQALNYPIQSTAACVTLRALQLCWQKGWNVIMQVHDQIVFDDPNVPPEEFERTARFAAPFIGPEFPIEAKVGRNWREVS